MTELTALMISKADKGLLNKKYREPAVTAYSRLEPRPRSENFERSLRAEVRDALWMLTRQWQTGELAAEDAGSAIDARLLTRSVHIDRMALREGPGTDWDETVPMEAFVEKEPAPMTLARRLRLGQQFIRLLPAARRATYTDRCRASFQMPTDQEDQHRGQIEGMNLYQATLRRGIDGGALLRSIDGGTLLTDLTVDPADVAAVSDAATQLQAFARRVFLEPAAAADTAWSPTSLDYRFSVAAPRADGQALTLGAHSYMGGRLDWWAFDAIDPATPIAKDSQAQLPPDFDPPLSFLPTPAIFKGLPNPRFWEMEDRQIDFGKLSAKTTDHLLLAFAEFGLVYGNDWFVIPCKLPVNTVCEVHGLVITDVFGERTLVRAANAGNENAWQRWSMFGLSDRRARGEGRPLFYLPPSLTHSLSSEPLETVNFARDEMANMVWAIEDVIPDATGRGVSGHEAADKTGVEPPPIVGSTTPIRYLLGTTVPENWLPFLPVHIGGSVQDTQFQRAAMPKLGIPPRDVVKAKGVLLNEAGSPYYVHEEEVPRAGTLVHRRVQRARWTDGKAVMWIGRERETGRGASASHLRFDAVEPLRGD